MDKLNHRPNVVTWGDFIGRPESIIPDASFCDYKVLAEGDSWFDIGAIPSSNLLLSMRFSKVTLIVNCAKYGDTLKNMSDLFANANFKRAVSYGEQWDLILVSGGGNDLINNLDGILLNKKERLGRNINGPEDFCNKEKLKSVISEIKKGYVKIASLRDSQESAVSARPIVTHTYDYATPRNSPAEFISISLLGPWLYSSLIDASIDKNWWNPISFYLTDQLALGIRQLAEGDDRIPNFYVIDTRNTLKRSSLDSTGKDGDWLNEIHPSKEGYEKIANKIALCVYYLLQGLPLKAWVANSEN